MPDAVKETPKSGGRPHTIRWSEDEWARIERTAEKLAGVAHVPVSEVDVIRGATMRRCDEVLDTEAAA